MAESFFVQRMYGLEGLVEPGEEEVFVGVLICLDLSLKNVVEAPNYKSENLNGAMNLQVQNSLTMMFHSKQMKKSLML